MTQFACRDLTEHLARGPGEVLAPTAAQHLATCLACRGQVAAHERLLAALRAEPEPVDDITRARWLARMAPELDAIAERRSGGHPRRRAMWLGVAAAAAVAIVSALAIGRGGSRATPHVATVEDRALLRPYVVTGAATESAATTLLAGRFAILDVARGELVRASIDTERERRIAVVGPARVAVTRATTREIELQMSGTLLVDGRSPAALIVRANHATIRAQHASFAVQVDPAAPSAAPVVFIDRGELEIDGRHLHAGEWYGADPARAAVLVGLLRDHENAIPGILAAADHDAPPAAPAVIDQPPTRPAPPPKAKRPARAERSSAPPPSEARTDVPPTEAPPREVETAAQLYARAEAALRTGDRSGAERLWGELLATYPQSPQASSALYDLAILTRTRDRAAAQAYLARLLAGAAPPALREPAHYLACRIHVEADELARATSCFTAFRAAFADSAHDAEVLAWLAGRAEESGGCAAARALALEYSRKYPTGAFAARAARCKETR